MADDATLETVDEGAEAAVASEPDGKKKLELSVEIESTGPCQRHVKVTVPRSEVDRFLNEEFSDLVKSAAVPGFRPGKTPRRLVERRFKKDVTDQVKRNLLAQSLEQVGEDHKLEPLSDPDIDFAAIELPESGDFIYEFDIEVRPEFDLPEYKGLAIKRPMKEVTDKDVALEIDKLRRRYGEMITKEGPVALGDTIVADVRFLDGKKVLSQFDSITIQVDKDLYFRDGHIENFSAGVAGAVAGDARDLKAKLSDAIGIPELRGKVVDATVVVHEVQSAKLAEMGPAFFEQLGVGDEGELRDLLASIIRRRIEYAQQQAATDQVMDKIVESANWDLPPELLRRMSQRTFQRKVHELEQAGFSEEEIRARVNLLRQNSQASTAKALKQQFVLQAIADKEGIKIEQEDLDAEVARVAERSGESARRVRARVEKEGLWESLAIAALERKTVERILESAQIQEVAYQEEEIESSGVDAAAFPEDEVKPVSPKPDNATTPDAETTA